MAGLRLEHIYKYYPGSKEPSVKDLNLEIQDKEFIVLVGPSGCGKTTTLRMIAGLEDISEGDLYIGNRKVNNVASRDRDIAMVFQSYALYPHMNVYQNMAFGLKLRKLHKSDIEARIKEAANILDIEHLLHRKPEALSGGQRQRAALGRAMVCDPQVFLMDEPLSNLDAKLRVQMRAEIEKLHKRLETTFVYVTHDQTEAMTMGSRIVIMKEGVIQQAAAPEEVYNHPVNKFVAGFIGSPSMNFIKGNLVEVDGKVNFMATGMEVSMSEGRAKFLRESEYVGREVIMGIRSEDLHHEHAFLEDSPHSIVNVNIESIENLGHEKLLYMNGLGDKNIIARATGQREFREGTNVQLAINMNRIHLFEGEDEHAIFTAAKI